MVVGFCDDGRAVHGPSCVPAALRTRRWETVRLPFPPCQKSWETQEASATEAHPKRVRSICTPSRLALRQREICQGSCSQDIQRTSSRRTFSSQVWGSACPIRTGADSAECITFLSSLISLFFKTGLLFSFFKKNWSYFSNVAIHSSVVYHELPREKPQS